jgi:malate synthase
MTITLRGPLAPGYDRVFTPAALRFLEDLTDAFRPAIRARLAARSSPARLDFNLTTRAVRESEWKVAPIPEDLLDRRVEITGPVDRKMIVNALSCGANVFMADFEDSTSPTWENLVSGQIHLGDAIRRTLAFEQGGKSYRLADRLATLMVRPRGLHLEEKHVLVNGEPIPGALFDFGLYFFHNAKELVKRGTGPYFYLPKLQSHLEARVWAQIFEFAEQELCIEPGTIRATVLIETLPAAFEMDEILYELRSYITGLNCGRWDYIFSFIKTRKNDPSAVLPDRHLVTMDKSFLRAYSALLVETCHRRGAFAMGGMSAYIPLKSDPEKNEIALAAVRADKEREAKAGHDGTWVAHPGLVELAREIFDSHMTGKNQLDVRRGTDIGRDDLLAVPEGPRTMEAFKKNVRVGIRYLEAWLRGVGCVPIYGLMEDAATAEISRVQLWQWMKHRAPVDGIVVTAEIFRSIVDGEMKRLEEEVGGEAFSGGEYPAARELFESLALATELPDFLTLAAYERIVTIADITEPEVRVGTPA